MQITKKPAVQQEVSCFVLPAFVIRKCAVLFLENVGDGKQ